MKLAIMQPYFLPYLGYFQVMNAVDKYIVYDDVNFIKGGRINRNVILNEGKPLQFNILLHEASPTKLIKEVELLDDMRSREKLLKTFYYSYHNAPFFKEVYPFLERVINNPEKNLALFIYYSFKEINDFLGIKTDLVLSSSVDKDCSLKAQEKVYNICETMGATDYYNSVGGRELYNHDEFKKRGINLHFLKMDDDIVYKQFNNEFVPYLSIIDVIMFNSKENIKTMLERYTLI